MLSGTAKRLMIFGCSAPLLMAAGAWPLPWIGSQLILHPMVRSVPPAPAGLCQNVSFRGEGVLLRGWRGTAVGVRRGTIIYLHGVSDTRASGLGVLERFCRRGFDVVAYDSRAHGESGGQGTTYGFFEKEDLRLVLDSVARGPIVVIGNSLGAAVALQAAAVDRRVSAVVAAESFSDLRTVVKERAPFFFSAKTIEKAIRLAERKGNFQMDDVSPAKAASTISAPVMLIHGDADTDTPPDHSRRVFEALTGPKRLLLIPGAGHNESLQGQVWEEIERWLDSTLSHPARHRAAAKNG